MKKNLRFPHNHRIVTKAEFQILFDKSKKIVHRNTVILFRENQKSFARLGVIVGKKTAKHAVVRNRIKRVIRESFRHHQDRLQKIDVVIIARKPCETLDKQKLREGIDLLWEKLLN